MKYHIGDRVICIRLPQHKNNFNINEEYIISSITPIQENYGTDYMISVLGLDGEVRHIREDIFAIKTRYKLEKDDAVNILVNFIECLGLEETKTICKKCKTYNNCKVGNIDLALEVLKGDFNG